MRWRHACLMTNLTTRGWTDSGGRSWHKSAKMPFFNQFSSVLFPGLMSGNWVPKNVIERVGVLLVGVSLSIAGFAFLAPSLEVGAKIDATIRWKPIALFVFFFWVHSWFRFAVSVAL